MRRRNPLAGPAFAGPPLSCTRLTGPDCSSRLKLVGELDLVTAEYARDALDRAQAQSRSLVCDLSDVSFVDLSGLRVLLDAAEHATLTGRRLTIAHCPAIVPRMLDLLGIQSMLDIELPMDARDRSLRRRSG